MKIEVVVVGEADSSYGTVKQRSLFLQDTDPEGKLLNPIEIVMTDDERVEWSGKVTGKSAVLLLQPGTMDSVFAGRIRAKGKLVFGKK